LNIEQTIHKTGNLEDNKHLTEKLFLTLRGIKGKPMGNQKHPSENLTLKIMVVASSNDDGD
jgi:hypothetical protein